MQYITKKILLLAITSLFYRFFRNEQLIRLDLHIEFHYCLQNYLNTKKKKKTALCTIKRKIVFLSLFSHARHFFSHIIYQIFVPSFTQQFIRKMVAHNNFANNSKTKIFD